MAERELVQMSHGEGPKRERSMKNKHVGVLLGGMSSEREVSIRTGEAIYTDDASYDPVRQGLTGFQRSPVRKRHPDR